MHPLAHGKQGSIVVRGQICGSVNCNGSPHADGERGGNHLEEGEGLEIDLAVAAWVAGLADVGHHDGHPPLVRIWIAFAHLQMGLHNGQGLD